jgi:two-component system, cell cycle response regulator
MTTIAKDFKLLIVDDSRIYRKLLEETFVNDVNPMLFAKSGREAMQLFAEHKPDLIITDWMMPDLPGVDLCKRMRGETKDSYAYIIILTSNTDKREILVGLSAGADDYLTKPFAPAELRARVGVGFRVIDFHRQLEGKTRLLEELALTDELTGLPNRRAVEIWAHREIAGAVRHHFPLSVVMADLDRFKRLNDNFGHEAGDAVLKKFAQILKHNCRSCDMYGRFGGEEFVIVLTHSDLKGAFGAIDNIRERLAETIFTFAGLDVVATASFGIATLDGDPEGFEQLVARADRALYSAKQSGRNRIGLANRIEPPILRQ